MVEVVNSPTGNYGLHSGGSSAFGSSVSVQDALAPPGSCSDQTVYQSR